MKLTANLNDSLSIRYFHPDWLTDSFAFLDNSSEFRELLYLLHGIRSTCNWSSKFSSSGHNEKVGSPSE